MPNTLDLERDAALVDRDQAAVRDGDAVRVARQIQARAATALYRFSYESASVF